jgi:hypothetical protein
VNVVASRCKTWRGNNTFLHQHINYQPLLLLVVANISVLLTETSYFKEQQSDVAITVTTITLTAPMEHKPDYRLANQQH